MNGAARALVRKWLDAWPDNTAGVGWEARWDLARRIAEQTAALRAALEKRDALLRDIADDNDPKDGCAYADLARALLADAEGPGDRS